MKTNLEREILKLRPELTAKQVHDLALDIEGYWIDSCLEDVLEATE